VTQKVARYNPVLLQVRLPDTATRLPSAATVRAQASSNAAGQPSGREPDASDGVDYGRLVPAAWVVGSAGLTVYFLVGLGVLAAMRVRSRRCEVEIVKRAAAECSAELKLRRVVVREAEGVSTPCVAGIFSPIVYLPRGWALSQPESTVAMCVRHEAVHVKNRDLLWMALCRCCQIALWPQPFVWLLARAMHVANEEVCDGTVVAGGASRAAYADSLVSLVEARHGARGLVFGFGIAHSRSTLARRVEALVRYSARLETRVSKSARLGLAIALACALSLTVFVFGVANPHQQQAAKTAPAAPYWDVPSPPRGLKRIRIVTPAGHLVKQARAALWTTFGAKLDAKLCEVPVKAGSVEVDFSKSGMRSDYLVVEAPGYGLTFACGWPNPLGDEDFVLRRAVRIDGRLLLPNGRPAVGVRVFPSFVWTEEPAGPGKGKPGAAGALEFGSSPLRDRYTAITDDQGRYAIPGLPQECEIALDTDDVRFAGISRTSPITVGSSPRVSLSPIRLQEPGSLEGIVTRAGKPVPGAYVDCISENRTDSWSDQRNVRTDASGAFRIDRLPANMYGLSVMLGRPLCDEVTAPAFDRVVLREGERKRSFQFALVPGALVKGRVTYTTGRPAAYVFVSFKGPELPASINVITGVAADSDGWYSFRVPAGRQRVSAGPPDHEKVVEVDVAEGEVKTLDFVLPAKREAGTAPWSTLKPRP
jgi:beta-lactamase regulating signal transducer with metallopeptidase domain